MEDLLFQYNPWWENDFNLKNIIIRKRYVNILKENIENKHIIFLTGLRRVGKTTLMKIIIKNLLDKNIHKKNILYVSVDDYLLKDKNLFEIIEEYKKIHRIKFEDKIFVFFDEIIFF